MLKYGREAVAKETIRLFNKIVQEETIPEGWTASIIIPIFKKAEKEPKICSGITLLSTVLNTTISKKGNQIQHTHLYVYDGPKTSI